MQGAKQGLQLEIRHEGASAGRRDNAGQSFARKRLAIPVVLLLLGLIIPFVITVGPLRLSVYRLVLIVFFLPCVVWWIRGMAGRIRLADLALLFLCFWSTLSFTVIHGPGMSLEAGGILTLETMGAYLMARCFIRDAESFRLMARLLFVIVGAMLPFAAYEAVTGQNIMREIFDAIYPSYRDVFKDPRWGLRRVQGPFEHPILFGVFASSAIALTYLVLGYRKSFMKRLSMTLVVGATSLLSLSSGPLIAAGAQAVLLGWNGILHRVTSRWKILAASALAMGLLVEMASSRSIPRILISLFAFNTSTAWNRLRIWDYGSASVLKHPFLGIGLNDWERPAYMVSSVDMFWLVPAMRHGLPSGLALQLAFFAVFLGVLLKKGLDAQQQQYRIAFLICMMGFYMSGWTVHFWNATYVLFIFLLGSGVWLLDARPESDDAAAAPQTLRRKPLYRRNAPLPRRQPVAPPGGP
jgi:hypothetical protein